MKQLVFVFALAIVSQFSFSQSEFKADVMKLMSINGSAAGLEVAKKQLTPMIPQAKLAEFEKEFQATLPSFYEKMAGVMMEVYTHEEVKQLIEFYQTPIGKKMAEKAGVIQEKSMQAGQQWGVELQGLLMKYME